MYAQKLTGRQLNPLPRNVKTHSCVKAVWHS